MNCNLIKFLRLSLLTFSVSFSVNAGDFRIQDTDHKVAYIQNVLLPRIQKVNGSQAYLTYESFVQNEGTGYFPGKDINQYWKETWGNINQPQIYNLEAPISRDTDHKIAYIQNILLPRIHKVSAHEAYWTYGSFIRNDGTGYLPGRDINQYWKDMWENINQPQLYNSADPISRDTDHKIAYIENILLPRIQKVSSNEAYWTYGAFVLNDGTGYLPGKDINQYWKDVWGHINRPLHLQYNQLSPIAIDSQIKIDYINSCILPKIQKLSSHPAYSDYKSFSEHDGTQYTIGMNIDQYCLDIWQERYVNLKQTNIREKNILLPISDFNNGVVKKSGLEKILNNSGIFQRININEETRGGQAVVNFTQTYVLRQPVVSFNDEKELKTFQKMVVDFQKNPPNGFIFSLPKLYYKTQVQNYNIFADVYVMDRARSITVNGMNSESLIKAAYENDDFQGMKLIESFGAALGRFQASSATMGNFPKVNTHFDLKPNNWMITRKKQDNSYEITVFDNGGFGQSDPFVDVVYSTYKTSYHWGNSDPKNNAEKAQIWMVLRTFYKAYLDQLPNYLKGYVVSKLNIQGAPLEIYLQNGKYGLFDSQRYLNLMNELTYTATRF